MLWGPVAMVTEAKYEKMDVESCLIDKLTLNVALSIIDNKR